jgi:hypothetical protein
MQGDYKTAEELAGEAVRSGESTAKQLELLYIAEREKQ